MISVIIFFLAASGSAFLPVSYVAVSSAPTRYVSEFDFDDDDLVPAVVHETLRVDPAVLVSGSLVAFAFLALMVVTVPEKIQRQPTDVSLPKLADWLSSPTTSRRAGLYEFRPDDDEDGRLDLAPISSAFELLEATLFQWRVFSDTSYPTGFYNGRENAGVELFRAVFQFFATGLANQGRYEALCAEECEVGPDDAVLTLTDQCCDPDKFVPGFGISIAARTRDRRLVGVASLRVRPLDEGESNRYCGYVTGIAVASSARRQGLASTLLDFCAKKARAWGTSGIALHANKFNTPALAFYQKQGFEIRDDIYGYNDARFLLYADFYDDSNNDS